MLEPVKTPYMKTIAEFEKRNLKFIGDGIYRSRNPQKTVHDAILSGIYTMIIPCKEFKVYKEKGCDVKQFRDRTYIVQEPFRSIPKNLFVPFTNPFVDKFQG